LDLEVVRQEVQLDCDVTTVTLVVAADLKPAKIKINPALIFKGPRTEIRTLDPRIVSRVCNRGVAIPCYENLFPKVGLVGLVGLVLTVFFFKISSHITGGQRLYF
jgi:hypothetical protein